MYYQCIDLYVLICGGVDFKRLLGLCALSQCHQKIKNKKYIYIYIYIYTPPLWPHRERVRLFTYGYGHSVREVTGSHLGHGTIVGGVFHPTRQLARFSPSNLLILNLFIISLHGEAINYRSFVSPSFEVASHVKISAIIINIYIYIYIYKHTYSKLCAKNMNYSNE